MSKKVNKKTVKNDINIEENNQEEKIIKKRKIKQKNILM